MTESPTFAPLTSRALIRVGGPDWRSFLQGLISQDVETLTPGEARFGALLTPQGRLLYDLFVVGRPSSSGDDGCWLDVEAEHRAAFLQRLTIYRLRSKVTLELDETPVSVLFSSAHPRAGGDPSGLATEPDPAWVPAFAGTSGWVGDPRLPQLGWRGYGVTPPPDTRTAAEAEREAQKLALGVPGPADWGVDRTYPIEANFDLLNGIDFQKGCFVGQETTSRMKRRGQVKSRMLPIAFDGAPLASGTEILADDLRAGVVTSSGQGRAIALMRLDRALGRTLTADGRAVAVDQPAWLREALGAAA